MICEKCGRKFDDDMPKCLWCDAPNQKYADTPEKSVRDNRSTDLAEYVEEHATEKLRHHTHRHHKGRSHTPKTPSTNPNRESGTLVFWLAFFGGFLGAHCFKAHRYLRGGLYLIFGGAVYRIIYKVLMEMGVVCPLPVASFFLAATLVVGILYTFDIWKIALEKYRNHKTHHRYLAKSWMKPMACIAVAVYAFMAYTTVDFIKDNVLKRGRPAAAMLALKMETYTVAQEKYFQKNGKIGSSKDIQYVTEYEKWMRFFTIAEEDNGLRITYLNNLNCPKGTSWFVKASVVDSSLVWNVTLPTDVRCNAMAPQIKKLKERLEKPLEPATSAPKLDEGVDGVGVVPDTTQHGDSL